MGASKFPGYLGSDVFRPAAGEEEWRLILRFDDAESLRRWEESEEKKQWVARADAFIANAPKVERVNGLEAWFNLPERSSQAPPKWKTAVVSAVGIYPVISFLPGLLAFVTSGLPGWLANLAGVMVMMPLMTWVVMPIVTRLFKWWLYPEK